MIWFAVAGLAVIGAAIYLRLGALHRSIREVGHRTKMLETVINRLDQINSLLAPLDDPNRMKDISAYVGRREYEDRSKVPSSATRELGSSQSG